MQVGSRGYAIALVTVAAVFWSTAGLFVRVLALDVWTMLAWRSLFAAVSLLLVVAIQNRGRTGRAFVAIGWPGLAAVPVSAVSMFCYVAALKLTSVANVMTVYATVPFVAAGIAYVWIGEAVTRRVLWASLVALLGIVIMSGGATRPRDLAGNALALLMAVSFGIVLVMARRFPGIGMAAINALAAALCGAACWPLMAAGLPTPPQLAILALFGVTTTALAYLLFLTGGRHLPSSEAALIGLLDVVLAPLWVWFAFAEQPGAAALLGGGTVMAALLWYLAGELRRRPA